ncbi:L,D-transpeptidase family protein [Marinicaulis aureus]|uniref:L,D-transpeptidase family protein n=1 Tax=Hyphococcus aureus TaxID=2666033 RepID=A0ABW1KTE1_9PROT
MKIFAAIFSGIIACTLLAACSLASIGETDAVIAPDVDRKDASALIAAVKNLGPDGVPETHYEVTALEAAMTANDPALIRTGAGAVFNLVAAELSGGLTPPEARLGWRMENDAPDPGALAALEEKAFDTGDFAQAFATLAPRHAQYRQLKAALAAEGLDPEQKARLRLNMERWRWMPHDLGADYILVNVPAFELMLVRGGKITARRRVVTGSPALPTPQLKAIVTGVIFNPTWFVPPSIVRESVGALLKNDPARAKRLGYYLGTDGGVRQKPGPANALGQMKLVMPNPYSVFLHDTPSKDAFQREPRALSHGCIRVEDATGFARILLGDAISDDEFKDILSKRRTVEIDLDTPLPVYVSYFTAFAAEDGAVAFYADAYGLDAPLLARFGGAPAEGGDPIKSLIEEACPESANDAALPENL